jgi:hypothetical protein
MSAALELVDDLLEAREEVPIASLRWSLPGLRWLSDDARYRVLRGGNGTGKSRLQAFEIVCRAIGIHPFRNCKPPPVKMAAYGYSHSSLESLMSELWHQAQGTGLDPRCDYDPGRGITGKPPRLLWRNGSYIVFLTYSQNSQAYAGKSLDYQALDEPCPAMKWGEIEGRTREGGEVGLTVTPTPEGADQVWVADKVREQTFSLTVAPLCSNPDDPTTITLESVTPKGGRPWLSRQRIAEKIRSWLPLERAMRCGLSWEEIAVGRQLDGFQPRHVELWEPPRGEVSGCCSTDHGLDPGRQASLLGATDGHMVWILGEYRPKVRTSTEQDAEALIRLLRDGAGWTPSTKLLWVGDRSAESQKWAARKANAVLARAISERVGKPLDQLCVGDPRGLYIRTPHKFSGSVYEGLKLVNGLFLADRIRIHPRCALLIEAVKGWEGDKKDRRKDLLDALRYLVEALIEGHYLRPPLLLSR